MSKQHLRLLHERHARGEHTVNINQLHDDSLTIGQKIADAVASGMGSWPYIIIQSIIVVFWIVLNAAGWFLWKWDLPPFILLNLIFSTQASYAAPIIMMSQNRQSEKDRLMAENDYHINQQAEKNIEGMIGQVESITTHLDHQDELILQVVQGIEGMSKEILSRLENKPKRS